LRAKSSALQIFFQHILGDMISPPIIGAISDGTGSLRAGLQITWMVVGLSGLVWWIGGWMLPSFEIPNEEADEGDDAPPDTTYYELLMGRESKPKSSAQSTPLSAGEKRTGQPPVHDPILELAALKLNQAL
jgi:hypothetical protein